jgi:PAS domain S-box-containing protein
MEDKKTLEIDRGGRALAEAIPALILTTAADGEIEFCNSRLLDYCGTDIEGLRRARWVEFIHPDDVRTGRDAWLQRIQRGTPFAAEYRIRRADGAYYWHLTNTAPLRGPDGGLRGWVAASINVDARHRAEEDALRIADELHRAILAKDEFLGLVSHELRTPITTIYGNAQVLRRNSGQLDVETLWHAFSDIEQEAIRLQQLVDNMFVLARIEAGSAIPTEPILLGRIADKVVAEHQLHNPGRAVVVNDNAGTEPVRGEPIYVKQIITNLLSNAQKYGLQDEPIYILLDRSGASGAVRVLDKGVPVPGDELAQMFDPFFRSPRSDSVIPGAGIGLAVCRRLVEAMGGEVWVQEREDGGLEAGFSLPLETEDV